MGHSSSRHATKTFKAVRAEATAGAREGLLSPSPPTLPPPTHAPSFTAHVIPAVTPYDHEKNETLNRAVSSFRVKDRVIPSRGNISTGEQPVPLTKAAKVTRSRPVQNFDPHVPGRLTDRQIAELFTLHYTESKIWTCNALAERFHLSRASTAALLAHFGHPIQVGVTNTLPVMGLPLLAGPDSS